MQAWKLGPALACGCTVVLKPAEQTPLSALRVGELILEAGFPDGVVNVVPGYGPTAGAAIARHMDVDKVAFTGSTEVGQIIMEAAAETNLKRVTLELGGKSPNIVFADADWMRPSKARTSGCSSTRASAAAPARGCSWRKGSTTSSSRRSVTRAKNRKVGDPFDPDTEQGPQVGQEQFDRVMGYIDAGKQEGAKMLCGGKRVGDKGYFIEPTVFADVQGRDEDRPGGDLRAGDEHPASSRTSTRSSSAPTKRSTASPPPSGRETSARPTRLRTALRAGTVWVNCYDVFDAAAPFGGFKKSGIGRELGEYGLQQLHRGQDRHHKAQLERLFPARRSRLSSAFAVEAVD